MKKKDEKPEARWRNCIVKSGMADPKSLVPNPENWRLHPEEQGKTIDDALREVGWIQHVIVNETTGHVVDGHKRLALALEHGEAEIPVVWVKLSAEDEKKALATFDPIGGMAQIDSEAYQKLIEGIPTDSLWMRELLKNTALAGINNDEDEDDDQDKGEGKDIPEMELHPFEHYDYLVFMFRNDQDFYNACESLGVQQVAFSVPNSTKQKIGLGRVVEGRVLVGLLNQLKEKK